MYENSYSNYVREERVGASATFSTLMRNVYFWMACGLAMTALTALYVATSPSIIFPILENKILFYGLFFGELGLVWYLSARIGSMSFTKAGIMFALYAILNGLTMSVIFLVYTMSSIANTFFITAGTFGVMSLVGFFIRKDLSTLGRILFMALIGLIIATVVNIFLESSALMMIVNYVGVLIFTGLTAYDTQKIKLMLQEYEYAGVTDQTKKLAILGSLTLYLDFINLFLYLLRFMGDRK